MVGAGLLAHGLEFGRSLVGFHAFARAFFQARAHQLFSSLGSLQGVAKALDQPPILGGNLSVHVGQFRTNLFCAGKIRSMFRIELTLLLLKLAAPGA
jgi:hypothetical protein